ncbi:MAG: DUF3298 and DUF4163 domain-containing protein [Muribaculaceae bacterium]|nr:DUF3298 and DUF4163 domain-containing protein [Muribaculaceae bacterium]
MKKNIIGKSAFRALLFGAVLCCTACGQDAGTQEPAAENAADSNVFTENAADIGKDGTQEPAAGQSDPDGFAAAGSEENDTSVSDVKSNITITMQTETLDTTGEDGTVYVSSTCSYPVVAIDGNSAAAAKINTDIRARIEAFKANDSVEKMAEEDYEYLTAEYPDEAFPGYTNDVVFSVKRADSNVISFTVLSSAYTGGAHGSYSTSGLNYNAKTGDLLAFAELSEDSNAFREDTLSYNQALAQTEPYSERMFSAEDAANGTLESVLYADGAWYLSTSGLVFISDPYALGPYAAGTIEFIIPYSELADLGFQHAYSYPGNYVRKLQAKEICRIDLNGDGQEDSVQYYTEDTEAADGAYASLTHLLINEIDFAGEGDSADSDGVRARLAEYLYADFGLYDLVPDDGCLEVMFVAGEMEGDDYVYYSHFYRYGQDGSLTYLGRTAGDANDPTVDTSELTIAIED